MTPLHFGESEGYLFGALSEPATGRGHGVVICPPIAQEHVRSHWALRQLTAALVRSGFHVLRFDWYGVGDSAGGMEQASLARWIEDAQSAARELRDATGVRRVSLVGLRMGAALAALALPAIKPQALVMWDPIADGTRYIASLRRLQSELVADERRFWSGWPGALRRVAGRAIPGLAEHRAGNDDELVGVCFPPPLRREIEALTPTVIAGAQATPVTLVAARGDRDADDLCRALAARGARFERRTAAVEGRWEDAHRIEDLLLPGETVRVIVSALETAA